MDFDPAPSSYPESESGTYYAAKAILREKGDNYFIDWQGDDPDTGKPWPPSWHHKSAATPDLVSAWLAKGKKKPKSGKRKIKQESPLFHSESESSEPKSKSKIPTSPPAKSPSPPPLRRFPRVLESSPENEILIVSPPPPAEELLNSRKVTFDIPSSNSNEKSTPLESSNPIIPDSQPYPTESQMSQDPSPPMPIPVPIVEVVPLPTSAPPPAPAPAPPTQPIMRTDAGPSNSHSNVNVAGSKAKVLKAVPVIDPSAFITETIVALSQQDEIVDSSPVKPMKKVLVGGKPKLDLGIQKESELVETREESMGEEMIIQETNQMATQEEDMVVEQALIKDFEFIPPTEEAILPDEGVTTEAEVLSAVLKPTVSPVRAETSLIKIIYNKLFSPKITPPPEGSTKRMLEEDESDRPEKRVRAEEKMAQGLENRSESKSPSKSPASIITAIRNSVFITDLDSTKNELIKFITSSASYGDLAEAPLLARKEWHFPLQLKLDGTLGLLVIKPRIGEYRLGSEANPKLVQHSTSIYDHTSDSMQVDSNQAELQAQILELQSTISLQITTISTLTSEIESLKPLTEEVLILKSNLSRTQHSLTSAASDRDFFQVQYSAASNSAADRANEARIAEAEVKRLEVGLDIGMKQRGLFEVALRTRLEEEVKKLKMELEGMTNLNRLTQGLRKKASLWDDYQARVELMEEEEEEERERRQRKEFLEEVSEEDEDSNDSEEENPDLFICLWRGEKDSQESNPSCGISFESKNLLETHLIATHCILQE